MIEIQLGSDWIRLIRVADGIKFTVCNYDEGKEKELIGNLKVCYQVEFVCRMAQRQSFTLPSPKGVVLLANGIAIHYHISPFFQTFPFLYMVFSVVIIVISLYILFVSCN